MPPEPEQSGDVNSPDPVLRLQHASRRLGGRAVVRALELEVARGEVLGLLGVNGAGKSTTLRMIAGVLAPSQGRVVIDGEDPYERPAIARRRIGYLPEVPPLHAELTPLEFLAFCARLRGLPRASIAAAVERALERSGLGEVRRRPIAALSKGFRQRVGIAQAIVHEPALIVLDEPASGLDPVQALNLRELVRSLGTTHAVVLSTHLLPDVAACCDRVAILHHGELRHLGSARPADASAWCVGVVQPLAARDWLALPMVEAAEALDPHQWRVRLRDGAPVDAFARAVVEQGFGLVALGADAAPLESTFLAIAASGPAADAA